MPRALLTDRMWDLWVRPIAHLFTDAGWEIVHSRHKYPMTVAQIREQLPGIHALMCNDRDEVTAHAIAAGDVLKVISRTGVGYDNVDVAAAAARGIAVTITPGTNAETVADMVFGLMLGLSRQIAYADRRMRIGRWGPLDNHELWRKTLGLVGFGRIGQAVARRARGFDLTVLAVEPQPNAVAVRNLGVELTDLESLLRRADFVSLHVPGGPATAKLINARTLAWMRPTACLINTARGSLVDEEALHAALTEGRLAGAAVDVWDPEPPDMASPLLVLDNVIATPHLAGNSLESRHRMGVMAVQNCLAALTGTLDRDVVVAGPGA
ncbi:MAG: phosphoglycerate dehydrogenase [Actinobacteria bacterium]|nr:phosphoglycerate dehydrogenase [Actinomycetota bacterium]